MLISTTGELEPTLLKAFIRGAFLRSWLSQNDRCHAIRVVSDLLAQSFPSERGTHHENSLTPAYPDEMDDDDEAGYLDRNMDILEDLLAQASIPKSSVS